MHRNSGYFSSLFGGQIFAAIAPLFGEKFFAECTPGYYNNEGSPDPSTSLIGSQYGGGPEAFFQIIRDWRSDGTLKGTELS